MNKLISSLVLCFCTMAPGISFSQTADTLYAELDLRRPVEAGWLDTGSELVGLRGDQPPLSWGTTFEASDMDGDGIYTVQVPFSFQTDSLLVALKIKVDGTNNPEDGWQNGRNHTVVLYKNKPNELSLSWQDQAPEPVSTLTGQVEIFRDFPSKHLKNRDLYIYLPPGYQDSNRRYPVLYMHDGQNAFDASAAGQEWQVDEAAETLINNGQIEPVIIVGIANTTDRFDEYTPTRQHWKHELSRISAPVEAGKLSGYTGTFLTGSGDTLRFSSRNDTLMTWIPGGTEWQHLIHESDSVYYQPQAGITFRFSGTPDSPVQTIVAKKPSMGVKGNVYGDFILQEVKPFVDQNLRTKPEKEFTALGGSSLGGLITLHLGLQHPDVFGQLLVVSPSVWWDNLWILRQVEQLDQPTGQKIWLDIGTAEGWQMTEHTRALRDALRDTGWDDQNLNYMEAENAAHNERAWAERFPNMLRFLYGKK
ncbi:alpha/beta hydrolase [Gracilimonas mengyeensis]|uniref:Esterase n=1 Tax=Gracilimonas mengyeensis TaxID=1302730 RepID=A0A521E137_9BACT|nr:alpha/beta hydrolase-fold protein [Gracilimonas mengyeensis]SMO77674.1 Putative esterase [Gracilimonas mengyeensis]